MSEYLIQGGTPLRGELAVHGAKNAALPVLAAALLCEKSTIHNCPDLTDVAAARNILHYLGCSTTQQDGTVTVTFTQKGDHRIPDRLMRAMRSSIVFLGAVIGRYGMAEVSMPGGCELGPRPIDMHLAALRRLGVVIDESGGVLRCTTPNGLKGARITLPFPSVGATENVMLAACTAKGETCLSNAAREPEIVDLADFLNAAGADIRFAADGSILIHGVDKLIGCEHRVIPDRIAAATYLCAAAVTGGKITLTHLRADHLAAVLPVFEEAGCRMQYGQNTICLKAPERLTALGTVRTMPYPGFSTDAQSTMLAMAALAEGTSVFIETIFESRYKQVGELVRMGANIRVEGRVAVVEGVPKLKGAVMNCTDLRGGAALAVAALAAQGESRLCSIHHIARGYENFDLNLRKLGAQITRV
ncbi:MAG: UDP-N-acetylglucosamine 1-carboxyvinyltransferase [Oscillospiraceae bacterium]|nr:UDP-N-acetylglucosamine 1-carboxyvinyltransferase [Oscillospiraceae bacterium]